MPGIVTFYLLFLAQRSEFQSSTHFSHVKCCTAYFTIQTIKAAVCLVEINPVRLADGAGIQRVQP